VWNCRRGKGGKKLDQTWLTNAQKRRAPLIPSKEREEVQSDRERGRGEGERVSKSKETLASAAKKGGRQGPIPLRPPGERRKKKGDGLPSIAEGGKGKK